MAAVVLGTLLEYCVEELLMPLLAMLVLSPFLATGFGVYLLVTRMID